MFANGMTFNDCSLRFLIFDGCTRRILSQNALQPAQGQFMVQPDRRQDSARFRLSPPTKDTAFAGRRVRVQAAALNRDTALVLPWRRS